MIVLDFIIVAAIAYFVFVLFFKQQESFEISGYNASTQEYSPVNRKITYNNGYIMGNLSKLLYEFTMDIERKITQKSTLTNSISIEEQDFNQASMEKRQHHINSIINKLNDMFNAPLAVIEFDKSYGIKEAFGTGYIYLLFKVSITPEFIEYTRNDISAADTGIKKESKFQTYNTIFLALDTNYNVYQVRLYGLESIDSNAVTGTDNNKQENQSINFPEESNLTLTEEQTKQKAQDYIDKNHEEEEGKCFIREGIEDNISFDVDCKLNGGIWDNPCKTNEQCPYYDGERGGCNLGNGYCEMPKGTKNISFKKYEGTPVVENKKVVFDV